MLFFAGLKVTIIIIHLHIIMKITCIALGMILKWTTSTQKWVMHYIITFILLLSYNVDDYFENKSDESSYY